MPPRRCLLGKKYLPSTHLHPIYKWVSHIYVSFLSHLGLVYFSGIFISERCGDMWGFGVHPILSNPLKYPSPKIL
jgi:hypothetical protein